MKTGRPSFIVIGAMKCGTSTVCGYLEDHPGAFMVPNAEPQFFSHDDIHAKGTAWYEAQYFADAPADVPAGEGSNNYASLARFPKTVARMAGYRPDMKIVYIVRHPVERIVSAWIQRRRDARDRVPATLDAAVKEMPEMFVDQSLYWKTLQAYRAAFGEAQVFVGFLEDLNREPEPFFESLCQFLDIQPMAQVERGHLNKSAGKAVPTALYSRVNRLPGMAQIKRLAPSKLRYWVRDQFLSQKVAERPRFSPAVLQALLDEISPDARALLQDQGKAEDFWDLSGQKVVSASA